MPLTHSHTHTYILHPAGSVNTYGVNSQLVYTEQIRIQCESFVYAAIRKSCFIRLLVRYKRNDSQVRVINYISPKLHYIHKNKSNKTREIEKYFACLNMK